ncbi:MAG: aryl-sulfate sulfotransferase [Myxococcota bacterium]
MFWLWLACGGEKSQDTISDSASSDTGDEVELTCMDEDSYFSGLSIEPTDISTVFRVSWTAEGDEHYLHYLDSVGASRFVSAQSSGNTHSALAVGLKPLESYALRPAVQIGEQVFCGQGEEVRPEALSQMLPESTHQGETKDGFLVTALTTEQMRFVTIVDGLGDFVWAKEVPFQGGLSEDGPLTQALLSSTNDKIAYFTFDNTGSQTATLHEVGLDGTELRSVPVPGWHISFTEVEAGVYAGLGSDTYVREDGVEIYGDTIVELAADGTQSVVWNSFDDFSPEQGSPYYDPMADDWMHANFLAFDKSRGKYMISLGRINAVAQVDRATGSLDWMASGNPMFATDIRPEDEQDFPFLISEPHSVQWLGDGRILVFNRGFPTAEIGMTCSEATELQLDLNNRTMTKVWSAPSEECLSVIFLGETHRIDDEQTLAVWSDRGQLDIFNAASESVWKVNLNFGAIFGFGSWHSELGAMR